MLHFFTGRGAAKPTDDATRFYAVGVTRSVRSFEYRTRPGGALGIFLTYRRWAMSTSTAPDSRDAECHAASWAARSTIGSGGVAPLVRKMTCAPGTPRA